MFFTAIFYIQFAESIFAVLADFFLVSIIVAFNDLFTKSFFAMLTAVFGIFNKSITMTKPIRNDEWLYFLDSFF